MTTCIFSDHHSVKLKINKTNFKKFANSWKLDNAQLKYYQVKEEIKKETKDFPNTIKINAQHIQIYGKL